MGAQLRVREVEGFHRRQSHDLAKLLREMNKESPEVLKILVKLMESQDEDIKLKAVKLFLEHHREIAKDINTDQMQRLLANHKYKGPGKIEDEDDGPDVDFNMIQET